MTFIGRHKKHEAFYVVLIHYCVFCSVEFDGFFIVAFGLLGTIGAFMPAGAIPCNNISLVLGLPTPLASLQRCV